MKSDEKFTNIIEKINDELDKLKSLNSNLSEIDKYVEEVCSIKENINQNLKELLKKNQEILSDFKNLHTQFLSSIKILNENSAKLIDSQNKLALTLKSLIEQQQKNILDTNRKDFDLIFKDAKNKKLIMVIILIVSILNLIVTLV